MNESYELGDIIVRYASSGESYGLELLIKQIEEVLTGGSIMQALSVASSAGFTENVQVILDSNLFNMFSVEQKKSMLSSAIASTKPEHASVLELLQSKQTSIRGGSKKTRRLTRKR